MSVRNDRVPRAARTVARRSALACASTERARSSAMTSVEVTRSNAVPIPSSGTRRAVDAADSAQGAPGPCAAFRPAIAQIRTVLRPAPSAHARAAGSGTGSQAGVRPARGRSRPCPGCARCAGRDAVCRFSPTTDLRCEATSADIDVSPDTACACHETRRSGMARGDCAHHPALAPIARMPPVHRDAAARTLPAAPCRAAPPVPNGRGS